MEKQKKISNWLKGLVILMAVMGLAYFGGRTYLTFTRDMLLSAKGSSIYFVWATAVLCYAILYQFWKVCVEIGKDNSFSIENASYFHRMAKFSGAIAVLYAVRIGLNLFHGMKESCLMAALYGMMLLGFFIFTVLCEALSQLIANAYEMKQENDLTI